MSVSKSLCAFGCESAYVCVCECVCVCVCVCVCECVCECVCGYMYVHKIQ